MYCVTSKGVSECGVTRGAIMLRSTGLVNDASATQRTTLGPSLSCARMCTTLGYTKCVKLLLHLPSFCSVRSMGPNGFICSGPDAGECVYGQCRCRQEVSPQVSLNPCTHFTAQH